MRWNRRLLCEPLEDRRLLSVVPSDPLFDDQWALHNTAQTGGVWDADIDAPAAWSVSTGSMSTVVAVLDTGVDYAHEDLYLNIWLNEGEIPAGLASNLTEVDGDGLITFRDLNDAANAGFVTDLNATGYIDAGDLLGDAAWADSSDTDGNGFVDDLIGWDTLDDDNDPMDSDVHGTMVTGILGAVGDNGVGMAGVNWQVRVMAMRFQASVNNFAITDAAEALDYAVAAGASISSNSWGDGNFSQEMYDAIDGARTAGHLFVASAGNWSSDIDSPASPRYPAGYDLDNIIAVAATDKTSELAGFSNWGLTNVDVAGPSPDVLSTRPGNVYSLGGGTSSATPHVSGTAALLRSLHTGWTADQIKDRILTTVDPLPSLAGKTVSGGRVNAAAAVADTTIHSNSPSVVEGNSGTIDLVFTVARRGDTSGTVALDWSTTDGTATAGSDYAAASGQVVFDHGETQKSIGVTVYGDADAESHETVFVNFTVVAGNATLADESAPGTILNDDGAISVGDANAVEGDESMYFVDSVMPAGSGGLSTPRGILVGPDGKFYVSSTQEHNVLRYDGMSGSFLGAFTPANDGVLNDPQGLLFGPDGDLYVAGLASDNIVRYDGTTGELIGEFVASGSGGLNGAVGLTFGDDGDLYVASFYSDDILRFDGATGAFVDSFVGVGSGGLDYPVYLAFGPDGNLYVSSAGTDSILRYHSTSGAFIDSFVSPASGGLDAPRGLSFEPDGNLYVVSARTNEVLRYDGTSGAFLDVFVAADSGTLNFPIDLAFDENRNLVVSSRDSNEVLRYAPGSSAAFTMTISEPMPTTVTIDFATADGSATAGSDYVATSGTVSFEPGQTERTIIVPTIDDVITEDDETFVVNLMNPTGGPTLSVSQGVGTILDTDGPLFSDSFEGGEWGGKWVEDSQYDWFDSTQRETDGSYSAEVDGRATNATLTMAQAVDLSPYGSAEISFSWFIESNWDTGEYIALDIYSGTWHNDIASLNGNVSGEENVWNHETIDIDSAYLTDDFKIRFRAKVSSSKEDGNVDNVQLFATSLAAPPNQLPVADAGGPYAGNEGSDVTLDGTASSDPDGTITSYAWDLDNDGQYDDAIGSTATFNSTVDGTFIVGLRVTDNAGGVDTDTASVTVANVAPTAVAGGPYSGNEGSNITLSASGSTDPGNDIANYDWDFDLDGQYDDASGVTVAFNSTTDGVVTVGLRVTDDDGDWSTDTAQVTVNNVAPTADAGGPYTVEEDVQLVLDASASSDPGNDIGLYEWDLDNDGQFDDATGVTATYTWAIANTYIVKVKVTDDATFDTASATVTVTEVNDPPIADAGGPYTGDEGSNITVDASLSADPGGSIASYEWDLDNDGEYDDATGVSTTFSSTDDGNYTVGVRVTDNLGATDVDVASVTVNNVAPTADAGGPYAGNEGSNVTLDASASSDPGNDITTFAWDLDNDGQYDDATGVTTTFSSTDDGVFTVGVKVTDDDLDWTTASTTVTVNNVAPTADAGGPYTTDEGVGVTLTAAGSTDPGNDIVSYAWDLDDDGQYDDSTSMTPTFSSATAGTYDVAVEVTDDDGASTTDSATVTVASALSGPNLAYGVVTGVAGNWQTVTLPSSYTSMVVIATPNYDNNSAAGVVRIQNATGNSFDVRVDAAGGAALSNVSVHYIVVEEGVYDEPGFKMEAVKFTSTVTDENGSWVGENQMPSLVNSYSNPVVVGQVMSYNDPDWSVFWARGTDKKNPPSSGALHVGKHVGEDSDVTRADETIGYLVIETSTTGTAEIEGHPYVAALGADTIKGVGDAPAYSYGYTAMPNSKVAVVSQAAMDGGNGGWAVLYGNNPITPTGNTLNLAIEEDQAKDTERRHTSEQVAYFIIDPPAEAVTESSDTVVAARMVVAGLPTEPLRPIEGLHHSEELQPNSVRGRETRAQLAQETRAQQSVHATDIAIAELTASQQGDEGQADFEPIADLLNDLLPAWSNT